MTYAVTFPMTEKTSVKGGKAHPFYRWMREQLGRAAHPAWNFHKLLTDKQGKPVAAFKSRVEPESPELTQGDRKIVVIGIKRGSSFRRAKRLKSMPGAAHKFSCRIGAMGELLQMTSIDTGWTLPS